MSIEKVVKKLAHKSGADYWRSLDEVADSKEFRTFVESEFPQNAAFLDQSMNRRHFLKVMAASFAMVGLSSCAKPLEKIIPYSKQPEDLIPGKPLYFASAVRFGGVAQPVLIETHMGRPTKIDGNPDHPESPTQAVDIFTQSSLLALYDPERSQNVLHDGQMAPWGSFLNAMNEGLRKARTADGAGVRLLTETVTSPTLAWQIESFLERYPKARWHQYTPAHRDQARAGLAMVYGQTVEAHHNLKRANVILSLDADFLSGGLGQLKYIREFSERRRVRHDQANQMSRLYALESTPGLTGAQADHRLSLKASEIGHIAAAIARRLGVGADGDAEVAKQHQEWIEAVTLDLRRNASRSLVLAGEEQPAQVHALAALMNEQLRNVMQTVAYKKPADARPVNHSQSLQKLTDEMRDGQVQFLTILEGNPVYDAPVDLEFAKHLKRVPLSVHLGLYADETAHATTWHIPATHDLETWSDARSLQGTVTVMQPMIQPLYKGRSSHELMALYMDNERPSAHKIVRDYWNSQSVAANFEIHWQTALHEGVMPGTTFSAMQVQPITNDVPALKAASKSLELNFRKDPTIWDGRYANNGWLQELPKPLTKLTWDNPLLIAPKLAKELELKNEQVVEITAQGRTLRVPVWIQAGHAEQAVTLTLGYGRTQAGNLGNGAGFNAYALRTASTPWTLADIKLKKTNERYAIACTQEHQRLEGRNHVREGTLNEYKHHPHFVHAMGHEPGKHDTLWGHDREYKTYAWGMSIDLNTCVGCNACVISCQSENNISVIGKEEVALGREMQWMRIDRYYKGDVDDPQTVFQPMLCQHCENAPCEPVCPVEATTHSSTGLNQMIYNRCVGTRYCSNNCPYKVRHFNFLQYADKKVSNWKLMQNPDVTVRSRGVMEKCTYCVQRINEAHINSEKEMRKIKDGEIVTACQSACPAGAIVFGDINDPKAQVTKEKHDSLTYGVLTELNTKPRTTYMARIRNPNPKLEAQKKHV